MHSILDAADWSKETTFTRFYLRDVDVSVLKYKKNKKNMYICSIVFIKF